MDADGTRTMMQSGVWYEIIQRIQMNDPGVRNGVLQVWLDGNLVLDQQDILWRTENSFAIDQLYFSTFFGGGEDWQTSKDEIIYFDEFVVSLSEIQSDLGGADDPVVDDPVVDDPVDDDPVDDGGPDKEPNFLRVPEDFSSIEAAIDAACPGDTVAVRGEWVANVVVDKAILFLSLIHI